MAHVQGLAAAADRYAKIADTARRSFHQVFYSEKLGKEKQIF